LNFSNGQTATSLTELIDIIVSMSPQTFIQHHGAEKNDTADWILNIFERSDFAEEVRSAANRKELVGKLREWQKKRLEFSEKASSDNAEEGQKGQESVEKSQPAEEASHGT